MEVTITSFANPFSFFCRPVDTGKSISFSKNVEEEMFTKIELNQIRHTGTRNGLNDVKHGQYVVVMLDNEWVRGVITLESNFLIWLIDQGKYICPNPTTVYINLPSEFKKCPTKVFEASIQGVTPIDKVMNDESQIVDQMSTSWNSGTMERVHEIISEADKICIVPVALLSTNQNDIVLGDLYIKTKDKGFVNIADELEMWPVFLQKDRKAYIQNLSTYYTSPKRHHACNMKPVFPNTTLPNITCECTLLHYNTIYDRIPQIERKWVCTSDSLDDSTVVAPNYQQPPQILTAGDIEKYSNINIKVSGRKYNMLNVLINKIRDLKMSEEFKDKVSVGRANTFAPRF